LPTMWLHSSLRTSQKTASRVTACYLWPTSFMAVRVASLRMHGTRPLTGNRHDGFRERHRQSIEEQELCPPRTSARPEATVQKSASSADSVYSRFVERRVRTISSALYRHSATACAQGPGCYAHHKRATSRARSTDWTCVYAGELARPKHTAGVEEAKAGRA
jgi:hypothetical protein